MNRLKVESVLSVSASLLLASCATTEISKRDPASTRSTPLSDCRTDPRDPYELNAHMPRKLFGPRETPCLDPATKRPIVFLDSEGTPVPEEFLEEAATQREITVANFYHEGKFWIAHIKPEGLERISFVLEHFPAVVPAAHSMLRFDMKKGSEVRLEPQRSDHHSGPIRIRSFFYSVEATGPVGYKYDLLSGLLNNYAIVYRFVSLQDIGVDAIDQQKHFVQQFLLKVKPHEAEAVLRYSLHTSAANQAKHFYNTITKNCTTEPYAALDKSINYSGWADIVSFLTQHRKPLPTLAQQALGQRGILERELAPLNLELNPSWTPAMIAKPTQ